MNLHIQNDQDVRSSAVGDLLATLEIPNSKLESPFYECSSD